MNEFYGKYRGKVENNVDPLQQGRVQVSAPAVLGDGRMSWAMPCVPYGGPGVGLFAIPPNGASVWVEFEGGDPDKPIWSGCFWGIGEVPVLPALAAMKVWKTDGITLTLSDLPGLGGVTLEVSPPLVQVPLKMIFDATGIELSGGAASVKLTPTSVSLNNGALEVM
ncbi:MAG: baseplate assembly protein [Chthonomonadales bacterium]|nr:baseplate assembly protein [Chthonomonadales bacterium]